MARPERNNVDYYPFLCKEGKAMFYIEQTYGNDGYATWVKILRQLAVTNYHYLDLNDKVEFMYLSSKCRVTTDVLSGIIQDLCDLGEFDNELWKDYRIIFSEKFVNSVKDAYNKRSNKCISLQGLLILLNSLGIRKLGLSSIESTVKPHRREEYTIEEKTKEELVTPVVPTVAIDFDKFITKFNSFANRRFKINDQVKSKLKARLKDYSKEEIIDAIEKAHKDKYHIENNFKHLTPEFILRPDKLEKFLNAPTHKKDVQQEEMIYTPVNNKIDHSNRV